MAESSAMSYVPTAEEVPYYNALFAMADTQRGGSIGGAQAVQFFSRSKLPVEVLKNVWTIADQPTTNYLDRPKFAVAVRLIQLIQNGVKGQGTDLRAPEGVVLKPAFFEGVPLPPVEAPPQPQQSQQPAPTAPQMQQAQPPNMPPRPPMQQQQPPPGPPHDNRALTVQDPYLLTPTEQARYEELFPTYAQPDGFVYGKEAVELFSKSGVPQNNLAAIWKMVDEPVDNRLDKLEFAMAMHLIVCLSRKNLPMPPSLPISLKQLRSQRPQQSPGLSPQPTSPEAQAISSPQMQPQQGMLPPPMQSQQAMGIPPPQMMQPQGMGMPPPQMQPQQSMGMPPQQMMHPPQQGTGMPSPPMQPQQAMGMPPPQMMQQPGSPKPQMQPPPQSIPSPPRGSMGMGMVPPPVQSWSAPSMEQSHMKHESIGGNVSVMSQLSAPPPLPSGGASISDAFDGLDGMGSGPTDINSYLASAPPVHTVSSFDAANQQEEVPVPPPAPVTLQPESPSPKVKPHFEMPPHMRSGMPTAGLSTASESQDLEQLREILQKLQAENIALKAQMGHLAEEESVVTKQVSQTAAELSHLSSELTQVRAQMLASKARLMEATAELNATKERKGVIQDLITEVTSTKEAIDDATRGVEESLQRVKLQSVPPPLPQTNSLEGDLFGFDAAPTSVPAREETAVPEPPSRYESPQYTAPQEPMQPQGHQDSLIQTVPSQASYDDSINGHHKRDNSSGWFSGGIMGGEFGGAMGQTASASFSLNASTGNVLSPQAINELKAKHREAENIARDAEESRRQIAAQTDELRRLADEAEKNLREYSKETDDKKKKKGMFGSGRGKKKDEKHASDLSEDARTKKEAFIQAQSQLNDATSLAKDTKAEVERLAKEIEDAEISAASAASMESAPPQHQPQASLPSYYPPAESQPQPSQYGGYSESQYGVMGGPSNSPYNPSVMGGGGFEIPTPSAAYDVYDNPFAS